MPVKLIFICALFAMQNAFAQGDAWTSYFGVQSEKTAWAGLVRGVGLRHTGTSLLAEGSEIQTDKVASLTKIVVNQIKDKDIIIPVGGLGSARKQERVDAFMHLIERDKGVTWKRIVESQVKAIGKINTYGNSAYWQVGNEINSRHYSLSFETWMNKKEGGATQIQPGKSQERQKNRQERPRNNQERKSGERHTNKGGAQPREDRNRRRGGTRNDPAIIPLYVEYLLAPTVEAIYTLKNDKSISANKINIMLGTLANSRSERAQAWLKQLLEYKIKGTYAPSLSGKVVSDLVGVIAIHYLISYPEDHWRKTLDLLKVQWVTNEHSKAIWSTEELGRKRAMRGLGAAVGLRVVFRFLDWVNVDGLSSKSARVNFYGARLGDRHTQTDYALSLLYEYFGDTVLSSLSAKKLETGNRQIEYYGLTNEGNSKQAWLLFPNTRTDSISLSKLTYSKQGKQKPLSVQIHYFSPAGHKIIPHHVENLEGKMILSLDDVVLDAESSLLVLIN